MPKILGKRAPAGSQNASKKRKLTSGPTKSKGVVKTKTTKGKERAYDRGFIQVPIAATSDVSDIEDEDVEYFQQNVNAQKFLKSLDEKGIGRSKKEQARLHSLTKPERKPAVVDDDLPSIDSHSEDDDWDSDLPDNEMQLSDSDTDVESMGSASSSSTTSHKARKRKQRDSEDEMPYETAPRKRRDSWEEKDEGVSRLPIKLQNGEIQHSGEKVILQNSDDGEDESESDGEEAIALEQPTFEDVSTGARFGRPAVVDVVGASSRKARIAAAKEQISSICQEIIADPENCLGLLRRLQTFCLAKISTPSHPEPVINDVLIRKMALLSAQAVFKDIIPGYRIRALTDKEKAEKVSQMVQRTRDFEQGLVSVYQSYLRTLEAELKAKSELYDVALQSTCRLLTEATHFNFRVNLMSTIVSQLSRKSWDESSDLCLKTLSTVLRLDTTGQPSLEIVRLLNRMIKERRFNVHPNVMFCLLNLRLKEELGGVRASQSKADKDKPSDTLSKGRAAARRAKGKKVDQPHLSKKAKKTKKELDEIADELREADAEVDKEERATTHTETLKLLFVLYFRIIKNDKPTPLLPAALQGISRFAHLVNVDFFKDLLQVLRQLVTRSQTESEDAGEGEDADFDVDARDVHHRLHCIVTAFELLTGQGEALNIDLTDFINQLYAMIMPLSVMSDVELPIAGTTSSRNGKTQGRDNTPADMLFRALNLAFSNKSPATGKSPPWRLAAFSKRLSAASLHFPPSTAARALSFVHSLFARESKLEVLLSTEDRIADGVYRPDVDDPQVSNPFASNLWELQVLSTHHVDPGVRKIAGELLSFSHSSS